MSRRPVIYGHQGWPARFPGNSLAGFFAVAPHVDGVELDVRRSADGKLVCAHDPDLGGVLISAHTWAELAEVDLGGGHRPALLDEAIAALPGKPVQIEVKNDPSQPGFEPDHRLALEAAERARPGDVVTSFNWASVGRVRSSFEDVRTGIVLTRHHDLIDSYRHCLDAGHDTLVANHAGVHQVIEDYEVDVFVWTVNEVAEAERLVSLGVSGIITDDPVLLTEIRR